MRLRQLAALVLLTTFMVTLSLAQPPQEGKGKGKFGPPKFEPGKLLPGSLREDLLLTEEQKKALEAIEKETFEKAMKLLTEDQKKIVERFATSGPSGKEFSKKGDRPETTKLEPRPPLPPGPVIVNPAKLNFVARGEGNGLLHSLSGDALEGELGNLDREHSGRGIRLLSGEDANADGKSAGLASWRVNGIDSRKDRWYRFRAQVLVQSDFAVGKDGFYLRVEFFKDKGTNSLDKIEKSILEQIERDRKILLDPATNRNLNNATWRWVAVEFRTPFAEVDTLQLGIGFNEGTSKKTNSECWIRQIELTPIPAPEGLVSPKKAEVKQTPPALASLVKLGGRWYYDPRGGAKESPKQFDHTNADQLYYLTDRLETPFAGNMTSWLRRGYYDIEGKLVEKDREVLDSVVVTFTEKHLVMKSKNLPNHPTAVFPDRSRLLDGNPNIIREQSNTWYIPLEPKENPKHIAMTPKNENQALPRGPIGVAINGVVFFNPFDESNEIDAVWRLDRCCGHPSPGSEYHYHKYPVCINTPWLDDGTAHSPLIGFAFDGFPVYGPYESAGVLAKDSKTNPINEFNLHTDEVRGPHYHVTPGQSPYILGGYWGEVEARNRGKKGPKK